MENNSKVLLMILDGWGIGKGDKADVIANSNTNNYKQFLKQYPNSQLGTSGVNVGLPDGQMGNSEVGHLNIGAGRIVYQDYGRINNAIADGSFFDNEMLNQAFDYAVANNKQVHLLGLVSDGGVHSSDKHLQALIELADKKKCAKTYIHALTDGRDTDPKSGIGYIEQIVNFIKNTNSKVQIASLVGRYYTMDRDKRWNRIKVGYDLMVNGIGEQTSNILERMQESYNQGVTDEFIKPIVMVDNNNQPISKIQADDVVICFNFRTDRLRQITTALTQHNFEDEGMHTLPLHYYTMTCYDENFKNINVIYDKEYPQNTLGEIIASNNMKQLRIAETEKYAHVTFFFNGGRETEFPGEKRVLIPSPKVATYDLQPEMSAYIVKDALVEEINTNVHNLIVVNFANGDMVGHTGIYEAITKAVEDVDKCIGEVVTAAKSNNYSVIIIADHGNADNAVNNDGSPNTAHSLNPVPCIIISDKVRTVNNGILADVAPTILKIMNLPQPAEMTGKALF